METKQKTHKDVINTEGIPEEMLYALYARAMESKRSDHHIYDKKAIEVVERTDFDFSDQSKGAAMGNGVLARTILLDKMVADYVRQHPQGVVVNIACGMDTRFYRVDNGKIRWYDLDLPVTLDARKRLLGEEERVTMIGKSVLQDESWADDIQGKGPVLFIVEGLTMYMERNGVQKLFKEIRTHFKEAVVFVEVTSPYTVKNAVESTKEGSRQKYSWGIKNGRQLQKLLPGFRTLKSYTLMEGLQEMYPIYRVAKFFPPLRNISNKIIVLRQS